MSKTLTLTFRTGNDTLKTDAQAAAFLRHAADIISGKVKTPSDDLLKGTRILDENGTTVGEWEYVPTGKEALTFKNANYGD